MSNLNSQLIRENKLNEETLSQELEGMSLEEMGEFFDSHSMADYWEETVEVEVEAGTIKPIKVTHFKDEKEMSEILIEKA
ncbi:MAG: hypothetical protein WAQ98_26980 [Blastocatellia bacterium]